MVAESRPGNGNNETFLIEGLKEKKEPSLGELNPLLFPPNLESPEAVEALKIGAGRKIAEYGGRQPQTFESVYAYNRIMGRQEPRLVVRFEVDELSPDQLALLETTVHQIYGKSVKTRTGVSGGSIAPSSYPELDQSLTRRRKASREGGRYLGWYMGTNLVTPAEGSHMGLLVYRDLGEKAMADYLTNHGYREWFFKPNLVKPYGGEVQTKYLVEIREAGLYQTDIVEFVTQVASVLGKNQRIENRPLKYEIYNELNRLGLRKKGKSTIYGLDDEIDRIERSLILPLANLDLASGMELRSGSVLLVGVPGTGKTLVAEHLLQQDNGVFFLPIDPLHIAQELDAPPAKRWILSRISDVFTQTKIPVILHIDDIENIAREDQAINSSLLNLMAGVRGSGFFALASTNHPEKINPQLLQPQRFAQVIHFGLPEEQARFGILDVHAQYVSRELGKPLFRSKEERDIILSALGKETQGFTARFLAEICTEAKSFYLQRIARLKNQRVGLREQDLGETDAFNIEDWEKAFAEVIRKYDRESTIKRDKELQEFARHYSRPLGYLKEGNEQDGPTQLRRRIDEIAAQQKQE